MIKLSKRISWFSFRQSILAAGILMCVAAFSHAVTVTDRFVYTAVVVTGGTPVDPIQLRHSPLTRVSLASKMMIVQGEAGTVLPSNPVSFINRLNPGSPTPPANDGDIIVRVTLRFRQVAPGLPSTIVTLPAITGPDFNAFAFQVSPSSLTAGNLEYQLIANKIKIVSGVEVITATATYPVEAKNDLDNIWVGIGVEAAASEVVGAEGGRIVIADGNPNDGQTILDIPSGLFNGPTTISIDEVPLNSPIIPPLGPGMSGPEAVYRVTTGAGFNGKMQLTVLYPDFVYPSGQDGNLDSTQTPETTATIVWWDGFKWRRIGGRGDGNVNTLRAIVTQSSLYAIVSAAPITAKDRRPFERIITPNGDGINDQALFSLGDVTGNVNVEIFDVTGHRVRTIMSQNSFVWDGRDDSGGLVESGVYIYQFKVDGERVTGLIAVAK